MPPREHHYAVRTLWTGASEGGTTAYKAYSRRYEVALGDKLTLTGSADPSFLGDASLANPEDLLVAALSACHMLSYLALCALEGIEVTAYEDAATGTMAERAGAGRFTKVVLKPVVTLRRGADLCAARHLHEKANQVCFIAQSVNFPVRHEPEIHEAD